MRQDPVHTREEALRRAEEWSTGERSHMINYSGRASYAEIAQMNTAEVQKFCALAAVLPEARHVDDPPGDVLMANSDLSAKLDSAIGIIEGYAHHSYGLAGKIAVDFLVAQGIWNENVDRREKTDPVYEVAGQLVKLILLDMLRATNADLAADGPVGDEEKNVWEVVEAKARVLSEYLDRSMEFTGPGDGARAIELERAEQRTQWSVEHDDTHNLGELLDAALCYLDTARVEPILDKEDDLPNLWPWEREAWHPKYDLSRNLVKAGALIAAEIDRRDRLAWGRDD